LPPNFVIFFCSFIIFLLSFFIFRAIFDFFLFLPILYVAPVQTRQPGETYPGRLRCSPRALLGGLAAKLIVVDGAATLSRCQLILYMTKPTHPQSCDAIDDLADLFGCVFWQNCRGFHFDPGGENAATEVDKRSPSRGARGRVGLGLLIFGIQLIP
jgi:hypothetical protein